MASQTNPQGIAKRKLASAMHEPLERCLNEMRNFCFISKDGHVEWPSEDFLDRFSEAIRRSASFYDRGGETIWDCVKILENRRRSLRLRKRIEDLGRRFESLYLPRPRALQIRKQALGGSKASKNCFKALRECIEGKRPFTSINWGKHAKTLAPRPTESYEARAAEICLEWLQWTYEVKRPAAPLLFWLMRIGNPDLLKTFGYSDAIRRFRSNASEEEREGKE